MTMHPMTDRCSIAPRVLPRVFILELICRWPLGYGPLISIPGNLLHDYSAAWPMCHPVILELICRWPLGYWPPITIPGDLLPDFSATWSTCHRASGPRGYLLLTSSTTDDRPNQLRLGLAKFGGLAFCDLVAKLVKNSSRGFLAILMGNCHKCIQNVVWKVWLQKELILVGFLLSHVWWLGLVFVPS